MTPEERNDATVELERSRLELERERHSADIRLRERELDLRFAEQRNKSADAQLTREDRRRSDWSNPLVIAVLTAALAAAGNAVVSVINGIQQRSIENHKSEQARILEMIKTGDAEKAAENLQFLLDAGLIDDQERAEKVRSFLAARKPGAGPALPGGWQPTGWQPSGWDAGAFDQDSFDSGAFALGTGSGMRRLTDDECRNVYSSEADTASLQSCLELARARK